MPSVPNTQAANPLSVEPGTILVAEAEKDGFTTFLFDDRHGLFADEPVHLGGRDTGPSPYDLLLMSLGSCTAMTLRLYASRKSWPLERVLVRLRHRKIHAADCETCETEKGFVDSIERRIELLGPLSEEQRARLLEIADMCPIHRTLLSEVSIDTALTAVP